MLRPLRTISSIKALKVLIKTLFDSFSLLMQTLLILVFFQTIFAIGGVQLFSGFLKKRCFHETMGIVVEEERICGYKACDSGYACGKIIANPNYGVTNFDNILSSFLQVFQCVTVEGWTDIMFMMAKAFSIFVIVYFIALVFIGSFFLVNLTLAVIKLKFTQSQEKKSGANPDEDESSEEEEKQEPTADEEKHFVKKLSRTSTILTQEKDQEKEAI